MEDEDRDPVGPLLLRTQRADEAVEFAGLQMLAHRGGEFLDRRRGAHIVDGDGALAPLGQPRGDLGGELVVDFGQFVEDAARRLAGDDRPGCERDAFGGLAGRDVGAQRVDDGLLGEDLRRDAGGSRFSLFRGAGDGAGRVGRRRREARSGRISRRRRNVRCGVRLGVLGGEFLSQFRRDFAGHQLGLLGGDLLGRHALLMLVQRRHLVAVLDGIGDERLHVVEARVAHRGQLDRRHVEVVLDPVLDPHRHQRVEAEFDQRNLPR